LLSFDLGKFGESLLGFAEWLTLDHVSMDCLMTVQNRQIIPL
jgi:hypothetical protein